MKKIPFTLAMMSLPTIPTLLVCAIDYLEERKRKAEYKIKADHCARDYANVTVYNMYRENKISDLTQMRGEWNLAYTTHLLEKHSH